MNTLYPPPRIIRYLKHRAEQHLLHVEISGNPSGIPVLFLHGGPGSGCRPHAHRFFNPLHYHIVLFDQRGCGRSSYTGSATQNNTTWKLIADIEALRRALGVDKWLLFGGSWGACLALCYAQCYPQNVSGLVLRGSFLGRRCDLEWLTAGGAGQRFPRAWQRFCHAVSVHNKGEDKNLVNAYYQHLNQGNLESQHYYAQHWEHWCNTVTLGTPSLRQNGDPQALVRRARIALHYAYHDYFLADQPILDTLARLPTVPIQIIHGENDTLCPIDAAETLAAALPWARFKRLEEAGHIAEDPQVSQALVAATDAFARDRNFDGGP